MNKIFWIVLIIVLIFLGVWLWGADEPIEVDNNDLNGTDQTSMPAEPGEEDGAVAAARQELEADLGTVDITDIQAERMEWTDGCLGLGGPAESCIQAITPGFRVELTVGEDTYVYRTNLDGSQVRLEEGPESSQ